MFSYIAKAISSAFLALSLFFGGQPAPAPLAGTIQPAADFRTSLVSGITSSATTMTLTSTSTASGEVLVSGNTYGFKIGGQEYVLGTLSAGKQITSMTRGVSLITGTTTGGVAQAWGRGTAVEITDAPILLQISNKISGTEYFDSILTYASRLVFSSTSEQLSSARFAIGAAGVASSSVFAKLTTDANTYSGLNTYTTLPQSSTACSTANQFCNKTYVDGVAVAGASNADQTTKGIVEVATTAEINAGTATGGTGAALVVTPDQLLTSTFANPIRMVATTTAQNIATSTLEGIPLGKSLHVVFEVASTSDINYLGIWFNDKTSGWRDNYLWTYTYDGVNAGSGSSTMIQLINGGTCPKGCKWFIDLQMNNGTSTPKMGTLTYFFASTTPPAIPVIGNLGVVSFYYASTTRAVQSISIGHYNAYPVALSGPGANYIGINSTTTAYAINP